MFTWGIRGNSEEESRVTIEIEALDSGCELTLTHQMDPKWVDFASRTETGWTKMLVALAAKLAASA